MKNFTIEVVAKKWRAILAILMATLSFLTLGLAQLFLTQNIENSIAKTAENIQKEYFLMQNLKGYGDAGVSFSEINDNSVYFDYLDQNDVAYLRTAERKVFEYAHYLDVDVFTYVVESTTDFAKMGLELYDGYINVEDDGVYITDYYINYLLEKNIAQFENEQNLNYSQMAGKTLVINEQPIRYEKVLGVVKTDYDRILAQSTTISQGEKERFELIGGASFISKGRVIANYYDENFKQVNGNETGAELCLNLSSGKQKKVSMLFNYEKPSGVSEYSYVLTKDGYQQLTDFSLGESDVILSYNLYNDIYGQEIQPIIYQAGKTFEELSQGKLNIPSHLGEKVSITLQCIGIEKTFLELKDKTIKGVIVTSKYYGGGQEVYDYDVMVSDSIKLANSFEKEYYYYTKTGLSFIFYSNDYQNTKDILNNAKEYNVVVGNNFSDIQDWSRKFYNKQKNDIRDAIIFAVFSIICFVVTILLLNWQDKADKILMQGKTCSIKKIILQALIKGFVISIISIGLTYLTIPLVNNNIAKGMAGFIYTTANIGTWIVVGVCPIIFTTIFALLKNKKHSI